MDWGDDFDTMDIPDDGTDDVSFPNVISSKKALPVASIPGQHGNQHLSVLPVRKAAGELKSAEYGPGLIPEHTGGLGPRAENNDFASENDIFLRTRNDPRVAEGLAAEPLQEDSPDMHSNLKVW